MCKFYPIMFCFANGTVNDGNCRFFIMPVKKNNNRASDWLVCITGTRAGISSLWCLLPQRSNPMFFCIVTRIRVSFLLYSVWFDKDKKIKYIPNPFFLSIYNNYYAFIRSCVSNVYLYLKMCIQFRLVLGITNFQNPSCLWWIICVIANFRWYLKSGIQQFWW